MNRVLLIGNLTHDPEVRRTQSGTAIMNFSIAVNNRKKNQQGQWEDIPCYVDCTMFGSRAESLANYMHKGSKVGVDGKLNFNSWTDKGGNKRSKLEVVVDDIDLLSPKSNGGGYNPAPYDDYSNAF